MDLISISFSLLIQSSHLAPLFAAARVTVSTNRPYFAFAERLQIWTICVVRVPTRFAPLYESLPHMKITRSQLFVLSGMLLTGCASPRDGVEHGRNDAVENGRRSRAATATGDS